MARYNIDEHVRYISFNPALLGGFCVVRWIQLFENEKWLSTETWLSLQ